MVRVEHWLTDPDLCGGYPKAEAEGGPKRTRVVHVLARDESALGGWTVAAIEVARETREGPYNGGIELFACGGGSCKVSDLPRPDPAALGGDWGCAPPDVGGGAAGACLAAYGTEVFREDVGRSTPLSRLSDRALERHLATPTLTPANAAEAAASVPDTSSDTFSSWAEADYASTEGGETCEVVLLPGSVWSLVEASEDGGLALEAGWLGERGDARSVSGCVWDNGQLVAAVAGLEQRLGCELPPCDVP